jgi:CRISPR-associated endoribonuclease Cas6
MQQIWLTARTVTDFETPNSTGYQLYSALLKIMSSSDPIISKHVHDSEMSLIAVSSFSGRFGKSKRPGYKVITSGEMYKFHIGITDPGEVEIFQSLIQPLIIEGKNINVEAGSLRIEEVKSNMLSFDELMVKVSEYNGKMIEFTFMSPACIQYKNSNITEMFPHRTAVFTSLLSKWNQVCPPELKMSVKRDELGRFIMEKPYTNLYDTHSVMVNTTYDAKRGHHRPIFKQGFTGRCAYSFVRNAPQDVRNAVVALSVFAEYSGVGSSVGRGCGWVKARMMEEER